MVLRNWLFYAFIICFKDLTGFLITRNKFDWFISTFVNIIFGIYLNLTKKKIVSNQLCTKIYIHLVRNQFLSKKVEMELHPSFKICIKSFCMNKTQLISYNFSFLIWFIPLMDIIGKKTRPRRPQIQFLKKICAIPYGCNTKWTSKKL